jgi:hypothetical protein
MSKHVKTSLLLGFNLGFVTIIISNFFVGGYEPLIWGVVIGVICFLIFLAAAIDNSKAQAKLLSEIDEEILLYDSVNCYTITPHSNSRQHFYA